MVRNDVATAIKQMATLLEQNNETVSQVTQAAELETYMMFLAKEGGR